ncbi:twin-arginine translocase subunit TatC [Candidatus Methylopumilus turicensis]|uniref:Sec-independent protein translocase protein TatC n=1 Tax=Candidatus Methylopumilus turicensis TaxID=1581680 RepID=A0A0B7IXW1_9PROT|nr:twin-arginine translocase subunit TatC [Candidatus Methylopumilus turicensis]CEN55266.1 TatABCE protein translocation system subunit [Candidatus Methylopumilus turicensis]
MSMTETFISHLLELRNRLLKIVLGLVVCVIAFLPFSNLLYTWLAQPLLSHMPVGTHMIATAVTTPFLVPMKVATLVAIVVSLPYTLYQAWAFVAPGLYAHERRFIGPLIVVSTLLFLAGMAFAYFAVFPVLFGFITASAPKGVAVMTDIGNYLDFVTTMFVSFGLAFEVPIAVVVLVKFNLVKIEMLKEARSYVIVGAFIVGAILTPPDVISQIMLAIPLWLLYEAGVFVAKFIQPRGDGNQLDG